ncbi:peptide deformylase [Candidatus Avelusimicrobium gallicola]|uniref:Peptide deformylase n=1 Tax=Candidatus Avelusimicrobium gallicola TaxID=2562704 RepID=A0A1Y4DA33_9BACT|nr:peptide deformylase [Elusimicrobium sp. An273]OUO56117.1 peptide deformylase [Elusimicrobium sp. An273]
MAILRVTKYGENILRQKLKPVDFKTLEPLLPKLLKDMEETCLAVRGVGLAANQIGLEYRMAVILIPQSAEENAPLTRYVIINPEILSMRGEKLEEEGCLSLPGLWAEVKRATDVTIKYTDEHGQEQVKRARGLLAKAFQHEVDHLDGKLFIDLVDPALKPEVKKAIKKLRKNWD